MKKFRYTMMQNQNTSSFYTITFQTNGGNVIPSRHVTANTVYTPPTPQKGISVFNGWFTDEFYENAFDSQSPITSDLNLYANWTDYFVVTFDSQGGTAVESQTVERDAVAIEPTNVEKTDFELEGWYLDGSLFNFETPITSDITLTASWLLTPGESIYNTAGTYTWTAPQNVEYVSVVVVGGGASGAKSSGAIQFGGGGGALGWKNNIPVVAGQSYTVVVGDGGQAKTTQGHGNNGQMSYFIDSTTVSAEGGKATGTSGATFIGDGGGLGSIPEIVWTVSGTQVVISGGGGAGGYSGNGGKAGRIEDSTYTSPGLAGTGGAGGGAANNGSSTGNFTPRRGEYGGGVGIYGQGVNGGASTGAGNAGSGGNTNNQWVDVQTPFYGGGSGNGFNVDSLPGANGAVRIIWGHARSFPHNASSTT